MPINRIRIGLLCLIIMAMGLSSCALPGIGRDETVPTPIVIVVTTTPEPEAEPSPTAVPMVATPPETETQEPAGVSRLEDVKSAVIQIEAQGSFVDPDFGWQLNAAGRGSGFIIDPSGLAITNNHVATGAALLRVWVAGESRARNARVLGTSECSDLAVIQIEGNEDFAFLTWYEGHATPGLDVYVAGFPLGDPEYTMTRGIVSKEQAGGNTGWASVDHVIEHDALLNRGNSGGPLVTRDGQVVGINFAVDTQTGQSYAIGADEARRLLDQLIVGEDVTSIGVNGQIVSSSGLGGIWVASVKSGSPADRAGIRGGDIILELEGLLLGQDGTMSDYCSVLRSHTSDDVMAITVLRWDTEEVLEGQLNGRELSVSYMLDDIDPSLYDSDDFITVRDSTDTLEMDVPALWNKVVSDIWTDSEDGTVYGPRVLAAPDIDAFSDTFDAPGVAFVASRELASRHTPAEFLDIFAADIDNSGACITYMGRETYSDPFYEGVLDYYQDCGDAGATDIVVLAALPEDEDYIVSVWVQYQGTDGESALIRVLDSFWVPGTLP